MRKKGIIFFFFYPFILSFSQQWEVKIYNDNYFNVIDGYLEKQNSKVLYRLKNNEKTFEAYGLLSLKKGVSFPEDFSCIKGDSTINFKERFRLSIELDKKVIYTDSFAYTPNPKGYFQLQPVSENLKKHLDHSKEKIIDQLTWEDSLGVNIFMRTELIFSETKYLYFYHFLKEHKKLKRLLKASDKNESDKAVFHNRESIQITDLNQDEIAEITCSYHLEEHAKKVILITDQQKYYLRKNTTDKEVYQQSKNLKDKKEFSRFLENKSKENE